MKRVITLLLVCMFLMAGCTGEAQPVPSETGCAHVYAEEVLTPAGYMKEGEVKKMCSKCGDTQTQTLPAVKSIRVLAVGNSFTIDSMTYLWDIFNSAGFEEVILGNLYIANCALDTHWNNFKNNASYYVYYKNTAGTWNYTEGVSIQTALDDEAWDVVVLHQVSGVAGQAGSYTNLQNLMDGIRGKLKNPNCQFWWNLTWAYQQNSNHAQFSNYDRDQLKMYTSIVDAVKTHIVTNEGFAGILPTGTAIQNLRTSPVGDTLTRDGYHLNYHLGRYTAALAWFAGLTGLPAESVEWMPNGYDRIIAPSLEYVRASVTNAVANPYEVTPCQ